MAEHIEYQVNGSGVPTWLLQILPPWFVARPAFTEALWAGAMGLFKSIGTVLFTLYVAYAALVPAQNQSFLGYFTLVKLSWFATAAPLFWSWVNGKTAHDKAATAAEKGTP